jgi:DNA-binding SARP family transcriptional activator/predicted negative regulator of RcsB-dependent stress response
LGFGVLGPLVVRRGGEAVPLPRSAVLRGLLTALAAARGQALSADRLTALVWAGRSTGIRPGSLHVGVSRLRRWLAALDPAVTIEHDAAGYRITAEPRTIDLSRLIDLAGDADRSDDPASRCELLAAATGLCRGRPLADLDTPGSGDPLVRSVHEAVRSTVLAYADAALAAGRPQEAIHALTDHIGREPLDEPAHARLIRALSACGRPAEALARYGSLRSHLAEELGVDPSEEVQRAHAAVLAQSRPAGATPGPALLPHDLADFTGRDDLLRTMVELLRGDPPGPMPIVALTGRAGVGKTALAVHAGHRLRERYPDGQLFVDLHGAEASPVEPTRVLARFLRVLGMDGQSIPDSLEERAEIYRDTLAHQRVLVVLDNAVTERQLRPLLPAGPGCGVLVTSRRPLTGLGVRALRLDVLAHDEAIDLLTRIIGDRRAAASPAAAAEIVRLCGNLPLAVRIAGGRLVRMPHRTPDWLAARLSDDLRRLDELALDDLEVRASLDVSYRELQPVARQLFRRLGLLDVPDFAGWVAAAVLGLGQGEASDAMDQLVDAHLLDVTGDGPAGEPRYRQHDLVRVYARERAEAEEPAGEGRAAVLRSLTGWLAWARAADSRLPHRLPRFASADSTDLAPAPPPADSLAWFESERPALVAGVTTAYRLAADELSWDLASRLDGFFESRGHYDDWAATHPVALRAARRAGNHAAAARILYGLGEMHANQDRYASALEHLQEARQILDRGTDRLALAHVRRAAGVAHRMTGNVEAARADLEAAGSVFAEHDDRNGIAAVAHGLGAIHREQGRTDEATTSYELAFSLFEQLGDNFNQATVLCSLGSLHRATGRPAPAESCLRRSLALSRRHGYRQTEVYALCFLGELYAEVGRVEEAQEALKSAHTLAEKIRERFGQGLAQRALGDLLYAQGDPDAARVILTDALDIWESMGALLWQARVLETLGRIEHDHGHDDEARAMWTTALKHFQAIGAAEVERLEALLRRP